VAIFVVPLYVYEARTSTVTGTKIGPTDRRPEELTEAKEEFSDQDARVVTVSVMPFWYVAVATKSTVVPSMTRPEPEMANT